MNALQPIGTVETCACFGKEPLFLKPQKHRIEPISASLEVLRGNENGSNTLQGADRHQRLAGHGWEL